MPFDSKLRAKTVLLRYFPLFAIAVGSMMNILYWAIFLRDRESFVGSATDKFLKNDFFLGSIYIAIGTTIPILLDLLMHNSIDKWSNFVTKPNKQAITLSQWLLPIGILIPDSLVAYQLRGDNAVSFFWLVYHLKLCLSANLLVMFLSNIYEGILSLEEGVGLSCIFTSLTVIHMASETTLDISNVTSTVWLGLWIIGEAFIIRQFFQWKKEHDRVMKRESSPIPELRSGNIAVRSMLSSSMVFAILVASAHGRSMEDLPGYICLAMPIFTMWFSLIFSAALKAKSKLSSQQADEALAIKRVFVRYVSHEIRTPLNTALMGLTLLEEDLQRLAVHVKKLMVNQQSLSSLALTASSERSLVVQKQNNSQNNNNNNNNNSSDNNRHHGTDEQQHDRFRSSGLLVTEDADSAESAELGLSSAGAIAAGAGANAMEDSRTVGEEGGWIARVDTQSVGDNTAGALVATASASSFHAFMDRCQKNASLISELTETVDMSLITDINSSCAIAVDILNDLLLYEKIDGKLLSLERSHQPAWVFVAKVLQLFRVQARSAHVGLSYPENCLQDVVVDIDGHKLSQVLRNLVSNALKFTPEGGKVTVSAEIVPYVGSPFIPPHKRPPSMSLSPVAAPHREQRQQLREDSSQLLFSSETLQPLNGSAMNTAHSSSSNQNNLSGKPPLSFPKPSYPNASSIRANNTVAAAADATAGADHVIAAGDAHAPQDLRAREADNPHTPQQYRHNHHHDLDQQHLGCGVNGLAAAASGGEGSGGTRKQQQHHHYHLHQQQQQQLTRTHSNTTGGDNISSAACTDSCIDSPSHSASRSVSRSQSQSHSHRHSLSVSDSASGSASKSRCSSVMLSHANIVARHLTEQQGEQEKQQGEDFRAGFKMEISALELSDVEDTEIDGSKLPPVVLTNCVSGGGTHNDHDHSFINGILNGSVANGQTIGARTRACDDGDGGDEEAIEAVNSKSSSSRSDATGAVGMLHVVDYSIEASDSHGLYGPAPPMPSSPAVGNVFAFSVAMRRNMFIPFGKIENKKEVMNEKEEEEELGEGLDEQAINITDALAADSEGVPCLYSPCKDGPTRLPAAVSPLPSSQKDNKINENSKNNNSSFATKNSSGSGSGSRSSGAGSGGSSIAAFSASTSGSIDPCDVRDGRTRYERPLFLSGTITNATTSAAATATDDSGTGCSGLGSCKAPPPKEGRAGIEVAEGADSQQQRSSFLSFSAAYLRNRRLSPPIVATQAQKAREQGAFGAISGANDISTNSNNNDNNNNSASCYVSVDSEESQFDKVAPISASFSQSASRPQSLDRNFQFPASSACAGVIVEQPPQVLDTRLLLSTAAASNQLTAGCSGIADITGNGCGGSSSGSNISGGILNAFCVGGGVGGGRVGIVGSAQSAAVARAAAVAAIAERDAAESAAFEVFPFLASYSSSFPPPVADASSLSSPSPPSSSVVLKGAPGGSAAVISIAALAAAPAAKGEGALASHSMGQACEDDAQAADSTSNNWLSSRRKVTVADNSDNISADEDPSLTYNQRQYNQLNQTSGRAERCYNRIDSKNDEDNDEDNDENNNNNNNNNNRSRNDAYNRVDVALRETAYSEQALDVMFPAGLGTARAETDHCGLDGFEDPATTGNSHTRISPKGNDHNNCGNDCEMYALNGEFTEDTLTTASHRPSVDSSWMSSRRISTRGQASPQQNKNHHSIHSHGRSNSDKHPSGPFTSASHTAFQSASQSVSHSHSSSRRVSSISFRSIPLLRSALNALESLVASGAPDGSSSSFSFNRSSVTTATAASTAVGATNALNSGGKNSSDPSATKSSEHPPRGVKTHQHVQQQLEQQKSAAAGTHSNVSALIFAGSRMAWGMKPAGNTKRVLSGVSDFSRSNSHSEKDFSTTTAADVAYSGSGAGAGGVREVDDCIVNLANSGFSTGIDGKGMRHAADRQSLGIVNRHHTASLDEVDPFNTDDQNGLRKRQRMGAEEVEEGHDLKLHQELGVMERGGNDVLYVAGDIEEGGYGIGLRQRSCSVGGIDTHYPPTAGTMDSPSPALVGASMRFPFFNRRAQYQQDHEQQQDREQSDGQDPQRQGVGENRHFQVWKTTVSERLARKRRWTKTLYSSVSSAVVGDRAGSMKWYRSRVASMLNMGLDVVDSGAAGGGAAGGGLENDRNCAAAPAIEACVRISVSDTGAGISKGDQKLLFGEFVQFKADQLQKGQGSGLGLWISHRIVKMHGGAISAYSEGEGLGTTFYIDIPIHSFTSSSSSALASSAATTTSAGSLSQSVNAHSSAQAGEQPAASDGALNYTHDGLNRFGEHNNGGGGLGREDVHAIPHDQQNHHQQQKGAISISYDPKDSESSLLRDDSAWIDDDREGRQMNDCEETSSLTHPHPDSHPHPHPHPPLFRRLDSSTSCNNVSAKSNISNNTNHSSYYANHFLNHPHVYSHSHSRSRSSRGGDTDGDGRGAAKHDNVYEIGQHQPPAGISRGAGGGGGGRGSEYGSSLSLSLSASTYNLSLEDVQSIADSQEEEDDDDGLAAASGAHSDGEEEDHANAGERKRLQNKSSPSRYPHQSAGGFRVLGSSPLVAATHSSAADRGYHDNATSALQAKSHSISNSSASSRAGGAGGGSSPSLLLLDRAVPGSRSATDVLHQNNNINNSSSGINERQRQYANVIEDMAVLDSSTSTHYSSIAPGDAFDCLTSEINNNNDSSSKGTSDKMRSGFSHARGYFQRDRRSYPRSNELSGARSVLIDGETEEEEAEEEGEEYIGANIAHTNLGKQAFGRGGSNSFGERTDREVGADLGPNNNHNNDNNDNNNYKDTTNAMIIASAARVFPGGVTQSASVIDDEFHLQVSGKITREGLSVPPVLRSSSSIPFSLPGSNSSPRGPSHDFAPTVSPPLSAALTATTTQGVSPSPAAALSSVETISQGQMQALLNNNNNNNNKTPRSAAASLHTHIVESSYEGRRVLIVDDSATNRKMLNRSLRNSIARRDEAAHGLAAVDMVRATMLAPSLSHALSLGVVGAGGGAGGGGAAPITAPGLRIVRSAATAMGRMGSARAGHLLEREGQLQQGELRRAADDDLQPYDAILMDYFMPVMNGPEATRAIRALGYTGAIIGVTGNGMQSDIDTFMEAGANLVLMKPVQVELLRRTLDELIG